MSLLQLANFSVWSFLFPSISNSSLPRFVFFITSLSASCNHYRKSRSSHNHNQPTSFYWSPTRTIYASFRLELLFHRFSDAHAFASLILTLYYRRSLRYQSMVTVLSKNADPPHYSPCFTLPISYLAYCRLDHLLWRYRTITIIIFFYEGSFNPTL